MNLAILIAASVVASAVSGFLGMGGGIILIAIMAAILEPMVVVPIHGVVQMTSNLTRSLRLLRHVHRGIAFRYAPTMILGAWLGIQLYRGAGSVWFRPAIGLFVLSFLAWDRWKPKRLTLPMWSFIPAGVGGGFLTITVGAAGPYLAAFFLRDDLDRKEIVATKATIQTFGHFLKIPAFLSLGFAYEDHWRLILPLLGCVVVGTFAGTWLLGRVPEAQFKKLFRLVLFLLAVRLLVSPWI